MKIRDKILDFFKDVDPLNLMWLIPICLCVGKLIYVAIKELGSLFN